MKKAPLGCLYGFVDSSGNWILEPQFENVSRFFELSSSYHFGSYLNASSYFKIPLVNYRIVESNGLKGLLNKELQLLLPIEFKRINPIAHFDSLGYQYAPCDSLYIDKPVTERSRSTLYKIRVHSCIRG